MKIIFGVGALAFSMLAFVAPATAADGWYINLSGGATSTSDSDVSVPVIAPIVLSTTQKTGPVVLGAIGKKLSSGISLEGELSYRKNNFDTIKATGTTTVSGVTVTGTGVKVPLSGDVTSLGFMANVAYDFMKDGKIHPYVMAGLGASKIDYNATVSGVSLVNDSDLVLAYQVGAGVNYDVTDKVALGLSYRLFGTSDPSFVGSDGTTKLEAEYLNHSVLAGLTYKF